MQIPPGINGYFDHWNNGNVWKKLFAAKKSVFHEGMEFLQPFVWRGIVAKGNKSAGKGMDYGSISISIPQNSLTCFKGYLVDFWDEEKKRRWNNNYIPESLNTNISNQLFNYKITFVNIQH